MNEHSDYTKLSGRSYTFPDSIVIRVLQVKQRSDGLFVTYETDYGNSLPRRFIIPVDQFIEEFGHLFP